jgi:hypothetical protein
MYKSIKIFVFLVIVTSSSVFAQGTMEDVVYLKNGSIIHGIIVEQIPKSIKIRTEDGNIFVYSISDIEKMTKEPSTNIIPSDGEVGVPNKTADYGIAICAWFGGELYFEYYDRDISKETSFLLQSFADFYLMEKLAMGIYANFSSFSFEDYDETATIYEFGVSIKPRFILAGGSLAIKPGLQLGYRGQSSDISAADEVQGMGLNFSIEFQFNIGSNITPFGIIGFLSQPLGGNDATDVTYKPIFYFGGGIAF